MTDQDLLNWLNAPMSNIWSRLQTVMEREDYERLISLVKCGIRNIRAKSVES